MARGASSTERSKSAKKSVLPPPPPPVLLRVNTLEELNAEVLSHAGAALVVVVSPLTASSTDAVIAGLERLNSNRPPALAEMHIAVVYALMATKEVCHALGVSALPFTRSYSYGTVVGEFAGDNVEKMELLAKLATAAAAQQAVVLAEQEKLRLEEAEANGAAAAATAAEGGEASGH